MFYLSKRAYEREDPRTIGSWPYEEKEKLERAIRQMGLPENPTHWFAKVNWSNTLDRIYDRFLHLLFDWHVRLSGGDTSFEDFAAGFEEDKSDYMERLAKVQEYVLSTKVSPEPPITPETRMEELLEDLGLTMEEVRRRQAENTQKFREERQKLVEEVEEEAAEGVVPEYKYQVFLMSGARTSETFIPEAFTKERQVAFTGVKPSAIWTSTLITKKPSFEEGKERLTSAWLDYASSMEGWVGERAAIFEVREGAKVLHLEDRYDLEDLYISFPGIGRATGWQSEGKNVDWESVSKYFDAVHMTGNAAYSAGWELESTAWFNPRALKPSGMMKTKKVDEYDYELTPMKKDAFKLSKRAQIAPIETPSIDVVIEPYDSAVEKAWKSLPNTGKIGEFKKGVEKVLVHSGGSGQLGHVEMGPGKNPREVHLYKNRIMEKVRARFQTGQPNPQQLAKAIEDAIRETLLHEAVHIGGPGAAERFLGETETERTVREQMPQVASFEDALVKASLDLEDIREKFLPNGSIGEPNLEFMAQSMSQKQYYLVKSGVRLLTRGTPKPVMIEIEEAEQFNESVIRGRKVSRVIGSIVCETGSRSCNGRDLVVALAKWQDSNDLRPTGKLDLITLSKFAKDYSALELPKNFGVVVPKALYRGAIIEKPEQLETLRDKFGVQRIVSLHNHPDIARMCHHAGLEHVAAPLECGASGDFGRKILGDSVFEFLSDRPTYIHCFYGQDRTGGVVARFRTESGWPCDAAYAEAKAYGFKDMFVDLIDWFSELCDKPPVDTRKIRKFLKNRPPYKNPEVSKEKCLMEQPLLEPHLNPVPNDMPFGNPYQDSSEHAYVTWADTINNVAPTGILSIPVPTGSTGV